MGSLFLLRVYFSILRTSRSYVMTDITQRKDALGGDSQRIRWKEGV